MSADSHTLIEQRQAGLEQAHKLLAANQDMWTKTNDGEPWLITAADLVRDAEVFRAYLFDGALIP